LKNINLEDTQTQFIQQAANLSRTPNKIPEVVNREKLMISMLIILMTKLNNIETLLTPPEPEMKEIKVSYVGPILANKNEISPNSTSTDRPKEDVRKTQTGDTDEEAGF